MPIDAELARLRWRCRRGTRELDQVLGWWFEQRYARSSPAMKTGFARLLDAQDPEIWDWVLGHAAPADPAQAAIIDEIRARNRV